MTEENRVSEEDKHFKYEECVPLSHLSATLRPPLRGCLEELTGAFERSSGSILFLLITMQEREREREREREGINFLKGQRQMSRIIHIWLLNHPLIVTFTIWICFLYIIAHNPCSILS